MNEVLTPETIVPLDFFNKRKNLYCQKNLAELIDLETPINTIKHFNPNFINEIEVTFASVVNYIDNSTSEFDIFIDQKLGGVERVRSKLLGLETFLYILDHQYDEKFKFRNINSKSVHHYSYFFVPGDCGVAIIKLTTEAWSKKDKDYPMFLNVYNFEEAKTKAFKYMFTSGVHSRHKFYLGY